MRHSLDLPAVPAEGRIEPRSGNLERRWDLQLRWQALQRMCRSASFKASPINTAALPSKTRICTVCLLLTSHLGSYHGWQFGPGGRCAAIPQADSPEQAAFACGNRRSCVASFPVQEQAGMLWVWMDASPASAAIRQLFPLPLPTELAAAEATEGAAKLSTMLGGW